MSLIEFQFQQYIGREVSVVETHFEYKGRQISNIDVDENDSTIKEIEKDFKDFSVRIWLPGTRGTADYISNRLNVVVEKRDNNLYYVKILYVG